MDGYNGCPRGTRSSVLLPALILVAADAIFLLALHFGL